MGENGSWGYGFKEVSFSVEVITIYCPLSKRNFLNWTRDRNSISIINKVKVSESCPTLCNFTDQNTGVGSLYHLQGIFPTQGLNPGLPHCRQILYQLSHKGSPRILEWVAYPFSSGSSRPRNWTGGLLHCRWFLYQLSYQGSPFINKSPTKSVVLKWVFIPEKKRKKVKLDLNFVQLGFHGENAKALLLKYHLHSLVL